MLGTMSIARSILVAFIALALVLPPVARAHVVSPGASATAAQSDCCPKMKHCNKQTKGDCADFAGCMLKCSNLSAVDPAASAIALHKSPAHEADLVTDNAISRSLNPPSPPPRV